MRFIHAADIHLDSPLAGMAQRHPDLARLVTTCTRDAFSNLIDQAIALEADFMLGASSSAGRRTGRDMAHKAECRKEGIGLSVATELTRSNRSG